MNECRRTVADVDLRNVFHNVSILQEGNNFDLLTRGLTTEPSYASDRFHEKDVSKIILYYPKKDIKNAHSEFHLINV